MCFYEVACIKPPVDALRQPNWLPVPAMQRQDAHYLLLGIIAAGKVRLLT
jgi:hypothetical protein